MRVALFCVLGLLLLTPFVVLPGTAFPFSIGKALWSRALIEIAFALWAVLALARPAYRPPRSWLLLLLAAGLGVSLLSAAAGVSLQRSLWSTYGRMQGTIDQAHWFALAVVLASLLRRPREWRVLLAAHLAAGAVVACLIVAGAADLEVPVFPRYPEHSSGRFSGPFGNPTVLSVYMLANLVLAAGVAARALLQASSTAVRLVQGAVWTGVAALHLAGLVLAGSVGGIAGLVAAAGFAALAFTGLAGGRRRLAAVGLFAVLAVGVVGLGARFFDAERTATVAAPGLVRLPGGASLERMGSLHVQHPSVQSRLASWRAGLRGFAERPLLGWGPENFEVVFGRHATGYAATSESHSRAHGKLVEVAATTGVAGVAAWLALWGLALVVLLRAARAMAPGDRALTVCAAAALAGHLAQLQFLFDTASGTLVATLLLAFAAGLESTALPEAWRARLAAPIGPRCASLARRPGARVALGTAAALLALSGLAVNRSILSAADGRYVTPQAVSSQALAGGIDAFPPLANVYRELLFETLGGDWARLRAADGAAAAARLGWADREAAAAVRAEPWSWRLEGSLARLYRAVAATEPGYEARARHHLARARALAPNRAVFPVWLATPEGLAAQRLADGRLELRWRPSPGAGYHVVGRSVAGSAWRRIHFNYDADRGVFVVDPCGGCRYRIMACRYPGACTPLCGVAGVGHGHRGAGAVMSRLRRGCG